MNTPEAWEAAPVERDDHGREVQDIVSMSQRGSQALIATVYVTGGRESNAALVAAAPTLLRALKSLVDDPNAEGWTNAQLRELIAMAENTRPVRE